MNRWSMYVMFEMTSRIDKLLIMMLMMVRELVIGVLIIIRMEFVCLLMFI